MIDGNILNTCILNVQFLLSVWFRGKPVKTEIVSYTYILPKTGSRRGWRAGSAVKNTCCPSRGSGFRSQHTYHGSQMSVTPVSRHSMPFFPLHTCGVGTYRQTKHSFFGFFCLFACFIVGSRKNRPKVWDSCQKTHTARQTE